jgi:hypothetical protein
METHSSDWFIAWAYATSFSCDSTIHSAMSESAASTALFSTIRLYVSVMSAAVALGQWLMECLAPAMKNQCCRLDVVGRMEISVALLVRCGRAWLLEYLALAMEHHGCSLDVM